MMKILILNAGSSSLKYQLMDMNGEKTLAKGLVDASASRQRIKQTVDDKVFKLETPVPKHTDAIA
jgi:acetate kinase